MALTKIIGAGAEGLTLSSTSLTIANGLTLTDGNVTLASGHGIDFAATANATDNATMGGELLDDYELGSWTPTDDSGAGLSLSVTGPTYTKIGRVVIASTELTFPSTSNSAQTRIGGLPFVVASSQTWGGYVRYSNTGNTDPFIVANAGQNSVILYAQNGGTFANNNLSTKRFDFVVIYHVA